jgi:hypothetical protein
MEGNVDVIIGSGVLYASVRQLREATIEEMLGEVFSMRSVPGCLEYREI